MTILHATRTRPARDLDPSATIVDPEGKAEHLLVHSVTRNFGGEVELACYPPGRTEGKRRVVRLKEDAEVQELANIQQCVELLGMLHEGAAALSLSSTGHALFIEWEGGWRSALHADTPVTGGPVVVAPDADCEEMNKLYGEAYGTDWTHPDSSVAPWSTAAAPEPEQAEPESLAGPAEDLEAPPDPLA